ncbi:hypothetical protein [Vibrio splendidus]
MAKPSIMATSIAAVSMATVFLVGVNGEAGGDSALSKLIHLDQ